MSTPVDKRAATVLNRELSASQYSSLRLESTSAKQNQQAILQWSLAAIGVVAAGSIAAYLSDKANHDARFLIAAIAFGVAIPFVAWCALGIWLGEVSRMERAGLFLREHERQAAGLAATSNWPADPHVFPISWESAIHGDFPGRHYGKNQIGMFASCALYFGTYWGSCLAALLLINLDSNQTIAADWLAMMQWALLGVAALPLVFTWKLWRLHKGKP